MRCPPGSRAELDAALKGHSKGTAAWVGRFEISTSGMRGMRE